MTNDIRKGKSYRKHKAEFEALGIVYYNYPEKELKKRGRKPKPKPDDEMIKEDNGMVVDGHQQPQPVGSMDADHNQPLIALPLGLAASSFPSSSSSSSSSSSHSYSPAAASVIDHPFIGGNGAGSAISSSSPYMLPLVNTGPMNTNAVASQACVVSEDVGGGMMDMTNHSHSHAQFDVRTSGNVHEVNNSEPAAKQQKITHRSSSSGGGGGGGGIEGMGNVSHLVHDINIEEQMSGAGLGSAMFAVAPKNMTNTPSHGAV